MASRDDAITVGRTVQEDVGSLLAILDAIIAAGGTTAFEAPVTLVESDDRFVSGPDCFLCFTAETGAGAVQDFQAPARHPALEPGWGDIGTFTRRDTGRAGIGRALFAATVEAARGVGPVALNATIRADNPSGIPSYEGMGFETYRTDRAVPLRDGTPVDRVSKRILLR